jgi:hypothetical protein
MESEELILLRELATKVERLMERTEHTTLCTFSGNMGIECKCWHLEVTPAIEKIRTLRGINK